MIRMSRREGRPEGDPQLFEATVPEMLIDMLREESSLENLGGQVAPVCITASVWRFCWFFSLWGVCFFFLVRDSSHRASWCLTQFRKHARDLKTRFFLKDDDLEADHSGAEGPRKIHPLSLLAPLFLWCTPLLPFLACAHFCGPFSSSSPVCLRGQPGNCRKALPEKPFKHG